MHGNFESLYIKLWQVELSERKKERRRKKEKPFAFCGIIFNELATKEVLYNVQVLIPVSEVTLSLIHCTLCTFTPLSEAIWLRYHFETKIKLNSISNTVFAEIVNIPPFPLKQYNHAVSSVSRALLFPFCSIQVLFSIVKLTSSY